VEVVYIRAIPVEKYVHFQKYNLKNLCCSPHSHIVSSIGMRNTASLIDEFTKDAEKGSNTVIRFNLKRISR
jgi:hypothetical protein